MLLDLILQVPAATDSTAAVAGVQSINYLSLLFKGGIVIYPIMALLLVTLFFWQQNDICLSKMLQKSTWAFLDH